MTELNLNTRLLVPYVFKKKTKKNIYQKNVNHLAQILRDEGFVASWLQKALTPWFK